MRAIGIGVVLSLLVLGGVIGFAYSGVFDHAPAVNADAEVTATSASVTEATVSEMEARHDHDATGGHEQD